jgi:hypothetical protein
MDKKQTQLSDSSLPQLLKNSSARSNSTVKLSDLLNNTSNLFSNNIYLPNLTDSKEQPEKKIKPKKRSKYCINTGLESLDEQIRSAGFKQEPKINLRRYLIIYQLNLLQNLMISS